MNLTGYFDATLKYLDEVAGDGQRYDNDDENRRDV